MVFCLKNITDGNMTFMLWLPWAHNHRPIFIIAGGYNTNKMVKLCFHWQSLLAKLLAVLCCIVSALLALATVLK